MKLVEDTKSPIAEEEANPGRTLIIGPTGFIGRFITDASLAAGHPTFILLRPSSHVNAAIKTLQDKGAATLYGSINDQDLMEKIIKENKIEYVISAVGGASILDQINLINAIKAAGACVKRFLPSEFGHDIDRANPVEPGLTMYLEKRRIRRAVEEAGIPYTYICCNSIAAWPYHDNIHPADVLPPLDRFLIYGDGSVQAYFVDGSDIGKFTMKSLEDDRTVNKSVHFRPPTNLLNLNELASLWEHKIGRKLPRVTLSEAGLLTAAKETPIPHSIVAAITHDIFIKGCQINYSLDKDKDEEICSLYPDVPFRTIGECFDDFLLKIIEDDPKPVAVKKTASNNNGTITSGVTNTKQEALVMSA